MCCMAQSYEMQGTLWEMNVLYGTELGNAGNTVRNEMCYMAQSYEMQGTQ